MDASAVVIALIVVPIVLVVALLAVAIPLSMRAERARRAGLRQWATQHGWTFVESSRAPWMSRLPGHRRQRVGVTLTGQIGGRWVTVADYSYETTSTSTSSSSTSTSSSALGEGSTTTHTKTHTKTHTHRFIVVVVLLDRPLPPASVHSRGALSKLGRSLFGDKPTATGDERFDSRFRIASADPGYARWLVGRPLREAHLAGAVPDWSLAGQELLSYRPGQLRHPDATPALAAPLLHVADLLGRDFGPASINVDVRQ
ncbi:hypothetical protein [Nocardia sp. NPDC004604]|uniref:hypothetical protein n=1 Tax=Nocardia sp. NPDC004604 TaxID=3157013 RepID=UPI0033BD3B6F